VNLEYAASAPALERVAAAVNATLEWYSSVHRGAGFKSRAATAAYEGVRESIRRSSAAPRSAAATWRAPWVSSI
jgi:selenocysteine lyase/cysteine desulfurase